MSILLLIIILSTIFLQRKPKFCFSLPQDGSYLSHERTNIINAIFITIIVLRHIHQQIVPFFGIDVWYNTYFNGPAGQSIVSTFFFYSGYGIMLNIIKKKDKYVKNLIKIRFSKLYVNMAICAFISAIAYALCNYTTWEKAFSYAGKTCIGLGGLWFIVMTLALYITTWLSFRLLSTKYPVSAIVLSALLIYIICILLIPYKPSWWLDTEICFPCGMLLAIYREKLDKILIKTRIPIICIGIVTLCVGWIAMLHCFRMCTFISSAYGFITTKCQLYWGISPYAVWNLLYPLCTVIYVMGITWCFASIQWQHHNKFLVWLGGPAVFYIFCLHFIPIRMFEVLGTHKAFPCLTIIGIVLTSLGIAYIAHKLIPRIDKIFFTSK